MKKLIFYLWQLPQNLLGLMVIIFSKAWTFNEGVWLTECNFGVSLGNYIIVNKWCGENTIKHEQGHQKQSLYLGWLYLIVIGLPSALGNLYDRIMHRAWNYQSRIKWYYSQPWEKWADKLGGVER